MASQLLLLTLAATIPQAWSAGCDCINPRNLPNVKDGVKYQFEKCDRSYKDSNGECLVAEKYDCGVNNKSGGGCLLPGDFGASCKTHPEPVAACYNLTTGLALPAYEDGKTGTQASWCASPWCFVNLCTCLMASGTGSSSCCNGASSAAAVGIFYSYSKCAATNTFTSADAIKSPHCDSTITGTYCPADSFTASANCTTTTSVQTSAAAGNVVGMYTIFSAVAAIVYTQV